MAYLSPRAYRSMRLLKNVRGWYWLSTRARGDMSKVWVYNQSSMALMSKGRSSLRSIVDVVVS